MKIKQFPFQTVDWSVIEAEEHSGTTGTASWKIFKMNDTRIRMVEYSANYVADHWCSKGHIIFCVKGAMTTTLEDGRELILSEAMSYHVGDNSDAHSSRSENGCTLFVVD